MIVIREDYWTDINNFIDNLNDEDFDKILIESGIERNENMQIKIENIKHGWLDFVLIDDAGEDYLNRCRVSYLTDVREELLKIASLSEYGEELHLEFDGEEEITYLTIWKHNNILFVIWEHPNEDSDLMRFRYDEFIMCLHQELDRCKEMYDKHFTLE